MNIEDRIAELEQKQEDLKMEIEDLKEQAKKEENNNAWVPIFNAPYYLIKQGKIHQDNWYEVQSDIIEYSIGNVFSTEEDAKFALERLKVIHELKQFARPFKVDEYNWIMHYSYGQGEIKTAFSHITKSNDLYFESEEKVIQAIETIGRDRIKKYYLQVED